MRYMVFWLRRCFVGRRMVVQMNQERRYDNCISIEEYLERRQTQARGNAEKEEHAKQAILRAGITEWSDLFYT